MAKVFLSYDRADLPAAERVAAALQAAGHEVWWDRHIRGGAEFAQEIDRALEQSDSVVVLWSANAIASPWVRDEAASGRDSGRLVPARIDNCRPPLGFRQYQTINLSARDAELGIAELDRALRALDGSAPATQRPAVRKPVGGRLSRRRLLAVAGASGAVAVAGGAMVVLGQGRDENIPPSVQPLMLQAEQLMNQNTRDGQNQAIGLYRRVVEMAPEYADGWGYLAHAYAVVSHYRDRAESMALRDRANAAARRALEIEPLNAMAEMAIGVAVPFIGHYAERDRRLRRALELSPRNDVIITMLAVALQFVGRSAEAVSAFGKIRAKPFTPAVYNNYIRALWSAGRTAELDQAIADAASLYPSQRTLWSTRVSIALYGGRPDAAIALTQDTQVRPSSVDEEAVSGVIALATAIRSRDPRDVNAIMARRHDEARKASGLAEEAIRDSSALGRVDDAFVFADAYYFSRGFAVPDTQAPGSAVSIDQRQTRLLFEPVTKAMRADSRFERLVQELGLDAFWRQSGKPPDYRVAT